ncbi:MAG: hypothetical protein IJU44_03540 [Kiritimatiellae bacterium]|nr:hypothetical protein [Kiritimatiellia bacterium]
MKEKMTEFDIDLIEQELAELRPLLMADPRTAEPSSEVMSRIHQAACAEIVRRQGWWRRVRLAAVAAALLMAVGGICHSYLPGVWNKTAKSVPQALDDADLILSIQGMDSDSFFDSDSVDSIALI